MFISRFPGFQASEGAKARKFGTCFESSGTLYLRIYPAWWCQQFAIENGHRNSGLSLKTWWFSYSFVNVYRRVYQLLITHISTIYTIYGEWWTLYPRITHNVGKTMPFLPPMIGNGKLAHKNGDDWGMVNMKLFYLH